MMRPELTDNADDAQHAPAMSSGSDAKSETASGEPVVVPLFDEVAQVATREVESGRVRVTTHTDLVEEHVRQPLRTDEVEVTRVSVNRTLDAGETPPAIRSEGNVTIVPVLEEVLVVEKRLVLKEELHIRREVRTEDVDVPVTLRKQRASVDRTGPDSVDDEGNEGDEHGLT